jgi:hypothetical protein
MVITENHLGRKNAFEKKKVSIHFFGRNNHYVLIVYSDVAKKGLSGALY